MSADATAGGFMLLGLIIMFLVPVIAGAAAMVKGFNKVEEFDRRRDMERDMRRQVKDANWQQQIARKLLDEYEE